MDKKLFLIDGHALIFKMYYAFLRAPMKNSKGEDTSILFGFTKYLLELIGREKPTHLAVAFDPPGGCFRHGLYPEYKANRDATPQLVIDALQPLTDICKALRIPVLMMPGFEADDVIGSMSKRAEREGFKVYMVTPDKDYGQLISPNIYQYKPGKGGGDSEIIDVAAVCTKYGINSPEQVIDILAIWGDASDNVPGVKGVGEVGAGKFVSAFGSVEGIYRNLDKLSPKQAEKFREAEGHIGLSKTLVTIKTDIEIPASTDDMVLDGNYDPEIREIFDYYEFGSLKKYIASAGAAAVTEAKTEFGFEEVPAGEVIRAAAADGRCAVLAENGTIWLSAHSGGSIVVARAGTEESAAILSDGAVKKYFHDMKPQLGIFADAGITPGGRLMDISLMDYLIDPEKSHGLEFLAREYMGIDLVKAAEEPLQTSLFDDPADYSGESDRSREAAVLLPLGEKIEGKLTASGFDRLYEDMEEPLAGVLSRMEREGIKMDLESLREFADGLRREVAQRQARIRELADDPLFNPLSPKQVGILLYEKLGLPCKVKPNDKHSYPTDEETLTGLEDKHPIVSEILEFRGVKKLLSTYIEPFPDYISPSSGKIHTTFNQTLTATGRLSSSKPNLQNIPIRTERGKEIRKAFVPSRPGGVILSADYSQIELRIMAHLCQDSHMIEAFKSGEDVHKATAAKIFGVTPEEVTPEQRRIAKTANFGIMYGISAFGLAQRLRIPRGEAKKIIDDYFASFPSIRSFIDFTLAGARENGYVETLFGRRRYVPDVNSTNGTVKALAERNAVNAPIQGTAADIIKLAMVALDKRLRDEGFKSRMVLQIHDELLFDAVPEEVDRLRVAVVSEMENVIALSIPLTVECNYGKNWLEAH